MPFIFSNRIEELASCHDYRLLKDISIPEGRLRRRHTDESYGTNLDRSHRSLHLRILPYRADPRLSARSLYLHVILLHHQLRVYTHVRFPFLRPHYQQNRRFPRYLLCRAIPVLHPRTPGRAPRHHITHLRHDHDPTLISEVSPHSLSRNTTTIHPLNCHPITPRVLGIYSLYRLRPGTRPDAQVLVQVSVRFLSIRTTNISHESGVLSARSASIRVSQSRPGLTSADGDPFDWPPAYTAIDMARSPLRVNGDLSSAANRKIEIVCASLGRNYVTPILIPLTSKRSLLCPLPIFFFFSLLCVV
ncbi:hypothetical protein H4582DRAFT_1592485 [Lactarius indigo]|nr:hypothetical protein H4582DRAFT_1592485 [Lactarius indigo]